MNWIWILLIAVVGIIVALIVGVIWALMTKDEESNYYDEDR